MTSPSGSGAVTSVGVPPAAGIRYSPGSSPLARSDPLKSQVPIQIVSSSPQASPPKSPGGRFPMNSGALPSSRTFITVWRSRYPTHSPSGEKNGFHPPSVPVTGRASASSSGR